MKKVFDLLPAVAILLLAAVFLLFFYRSEAQDVVIDDECFDVVPMGVLVPVSCPAPTPCPWNPYIPDTDPACTECEWVPGIWSGDAACIEPPPPELCEWSDTILAIDVRCVECQWVAGIWAEDPACVDSGRTDITVTWTNPPASDITRIKLWWQASQTDTSSTTAYSSYSDTNPDTTYLVSFDPPLEDCLYAKYYLSGVKGPASNLACVSSDGRDLVLYWGAPVPPVGEAILDWTNPDQNEDGSVLDDLATVRIYTAGGSALVDVPVSVPGAPGNTIIATDETCFYATALDTGGNESSVSTTACQP